MATLQRPPRQRVFEHALSGLFGLATLGLLLGFVWPRSTRGRLGKSAQRKQLLTSAVAIFLVPLMGVDLSILADLNARAWQRAALADTTVVDEVVEYVYDHDGNLSIKLVGSSTVTPVPTDGWLYDAENRLTLYEPQPCVDFPTCDPATSASAVRYAYDHDGVRITERTGTGNWKHYVVDKQRPYAQVLAEVIETQGTQARYHYGHDLLTLERGGATYTYHTDGQTSTRLLTDASGEVVGTYSYDAFGEQLKDAGEMGNAPDFAGSGDLNGYRYTGEQYDAVSGQYYLRARYYQPGRGALPGAIRLRDTRKSRTRCTLTRIAPTIR